MSNNFLGLDNNSAISKNSAECLLNLFQFNLLNNGGSSGNASSNHLNNIIGGGNTSSITNGFVNNGVSNTKPIFFGGTGKPAGNTGRAITNTGNLANSSFGQQDVFSKAASELIGNDYKSGVHRLSNSSGDSSMGSQAKPFNDASSYGGDFSDFLGRDPFYTSMQNAQSPRLNNISNNAFPPIGTFTLESTNPQPNPMFAPPADYFNASNHSNNTHMNGTGGNSSNPSNASSIFNSTNNNGGDPNQATRETGIIEKLLHSYGFIQCCERQARLFFHFSQFSGNIEHLKIGDPVEFEMTYDRRTGKPIASQVTKIAPEVVLSEERVTGTVTTELKSDNSTTSTGGETTTGRISYENRGECFFLPYNKDDVEGNVTLRAGDKVSFQIATNQRGNLGACHIRLENPVHPVKYRGVVCSMKESFGFIERADVVKEIFFHFSEAEGDIELRPGDDVEFTIQTRNLSPEQGKEVACNITRLPPGSVVFEDIGTTLHTGQVLKPLDRANPQRHNNDPLPGRIRYRAQDHSEVEVQFGDKDQKGDFTLRHGDWVQFLLATDRRDQLQRATSISLMDQTFEVSGERREQGVVFSLKDQFGFLRCVDRNVRLFFHFTEVLDTTREICVGDEVEFTTISDPSASSSNIRFSAIRIKHLPPGKVQFETLMEKNVEGVVTREAPKSPIKSQERMEGGVITYAQANNKKTIMYFLKDCEKPPRVGDHVRFDICQVKRNKELIAVNIVDINATQSANAMNGSSQSNDNQSTTDDVPQHRSNTNNVSRSSQNNKKSDDSNGTTYQGFIAVLKETFGFIETVKHDEEVFFHFSNCIGNPNTFELGQEVEYTLAKRNASSGGACLPGENVKILEKGTIPQPAVIDKIYNGIVTRPLRCTNPNQQQYSGLIDCLNDAGETVSTHELGITSLTNKRDLLQKDDYVVFKIDESGRAADVTAVRQKKRANVDSIKGQFGFLDYEVEEGKKLFFHMTEVHGNANNLYAGDSVEFSVVTNQRTGKSSACNVVKVADNSSTRPSGLFIRNKLNSIDETVPRMIAIRQPKGPEGKGFSNACRAIRLPGVSVD